ncbi:peptidoglycan hydrolase-like protein with peptidoglycan-binding domain [Rhodoligotrophos appendicifer]|uniref:peptidoglycan-binding domain-containing protein n=1 Tax=Rhodoligotrophos appendicifer TaxID=987056 RepID=UPI0019613ECA|nr:peptidoglycan-binding domain-containing protein [Rhodoligotrophos appendicifer]
MVYYSGNRRSDLGRGDRGSDVADLQRQLADLGYNPGRADGIYGSRTANAVAQFERNHDLPRDGFADVSTRWKLYDTWQQVVGNGNAPVEEASPSGYGYEPDYGFYG